MNLHPIELHATFEEGQAPPPTSTAASPCISCTPGPSGALRTSGAWCAVMASPVSASHAVQSSPCAASCWRKRYKVRHACEKPAGGGHFGRAGRVLYRSSPARFLSGDFSVTSVPSVSPVAVLPPPTGATSGPSGALRTSSGGFALHEAFWGRVVGVSDPHVVQFPPIAAGEARREAV